MNISELVRLAIRLDAIGRYDIADEVDRVAETHPGTGLSMQLLPQEDTTMRGPAGAAIVENDRDHGVETMDDLKQVEKKPRRKGVPKTPGVSIGVTVKMNSGPDDGRTV